MHLYRTGKSFEEGICDVCHTKEIMFVEVYTYDWLIN
jgi:hypothetical protein